MTNSQRLRPIMGWSLLAVFLVFYGCCFARRSRRFIKDRRASFFEVGRIAERFNRYARRLQLENASYMGPDMGGTLWYSHLRVYDSAGLIDTTVAHTRPYRLGARRNADRTQQQGGDARALCNYIFDDIKPTFIRFKQSYAPFCSDPRFHRDYVSLHADRQCHGAWEYARRDAVRGKERLLRSIEAEVNGGLRRQGVRKNEP